MDDDPVAEGACSCSGGVDRKGFTRPEGCSYRNTRRNGLIFHNRVLTRRDCRSNTVQGVLLWVAADLDVVLGEFECSQARVTIHRVGRVVRGERDGDRVSAPKVVVTVTPDATASFFTTVY